MEQLSYHIEIAALGC